MSKIWTRSFSLELLQAIHNFSSDTFKMALYSDSSTIDDTTAAYTATNEITGTGYSAGGVIVAVSSGYPQLVNDCGSVRFDAATWAAATFTYRKAMLYNSSKANRSVMVFDFGVTRGPTAGTHTITTPLSALPIIFVNRG